MNTHINPIAKGRAITDRLAKHAIANRVVKQLDKIYECMEKLNPLGLKFASRIDDIDTPFLCSEEPFTEQEAIDLCVKAWVPVSLKHQKMIDELWHIEILCRFEPSLKLEYDCALMEQAIIQTTTRIVGAKGNNPDAGEYSHLDPIAQAILVRDQDLKEAKLEDPPGTTFLAVVIVIATAIVFCICIIA